MPRSDRSQEPLGRAEPSVEEAARLRDRRRRRVSTITRWAVAATVAGTGALGAGYAAALPGNSAKPAPPATAPSGGGGGATGSAHSPATSPSGGASSKPSKTSGGLRSPAHPPQPTTHPPQTTSGGS